MDLPKNLQQEIEKALSSQFQHVELVGFSYTGGGSINNTGIISTNVGNYFIKWNNAKLYPEMFEKEAQGLQILRNTDVINIPDTISCGIAGSESYLILENIDPVNQATGFWEQFGQSLALLHQSTNQFFGLDHDNYIGSLTQQNNYHDNWYSFFIEERLIPQIKLAGNSKKLNDTLIKNFNRFMKVLPEIFPEEKPALLHGDLWNGNFMVNNKGEACIFDPAVYYGNREAEISFTKMFGGFDTRFYDAYSSAFPMEQGFEARVDYYNLYPLLVHLNLFGGGYLNTVKMIIKRF